MGLDSFSTGNNTTSSRTVSQNNQEQNQQDEDDEPFKKVSGDKGREKVFPTKEDWEETVEFVETEMDMSIDEVLNRSAGERYELLHQAILQKKDGESTPFHPTNECVVCGQEFIFPKNWNFTRVRGEAACNDHSIGEVMEAVRDVNLGMV